MSYCMQCSELTRAVNMRTSASYKTGSSTVVEIKRSMGISEAKRDEETAECTHHAEIIKLSTAQKQGGKQRLRSFSY